MKRVLLVLAIWLVEFSAMAIEGRYPMAGIRNSGGSAGLPFFDHSTGGCTLPFTLPCTLGG